MKKRIIVFITIISLCHQLKAQSAYSVSAKVAEVVVFIGKDSIYHGVIVSFINHSGDSIYIPDIRNMLLVNRQLGVVVIERDSVPFGNYKDIHIKNNLRMDSALKSWGYSDVGSGQTGLDHPPMGLLKRLPTPLEKFARLQNKIYFNNMTIILKNYPALKGIDLSGNCIYLKPSQDKKYVLVSKIQSIFNTPGHYKIYYQPMLDSSNTDKYPEVVNGYKKYVPSKISSNVIYVDVVK